MATRKARTKSAGEQLTEYRKKRDFSKTAEPAGESETPEAGPLRFVIQKHAASHLHFDLRLELDGVMKSWAVPKGPSVDPSVKRLAMQVEDHPIEYNTFEGTIPKGEYGGGTVMLWDTGTYTADGVAPDQAEDELRERYAKGDLKVTFFGDRMRGSWALVRMKYSRDNSSSSKPQWLFIKHRDEYASETDIVEENMTLRLQPAERWKKSRPERARCGTATGRRKPVSPKRSSKKSAVKTAAKPAAAKTVDRSALVRALEPMYASRRHVGPRRRLDLRAEVRRSARPCLRHR